MINAKMKNFAISVLAFVMCLTLAFGIAGFSKDSVALAADSTLVIFDGSVDTVMPTTGTDAVSGSTFEVVGLSKVQSDKINSSHNAINTGGNCKSSRYIKFVIASGYTADISLIAYTNSSSKVRRTFVATELTTDYTKAINGLICDEAQYNHTEKTATLAAGTYYINFDASVNIYKAVLEINAEAIVATYDAGDGSNAPENQKLPTSSTSLTVGAAPTAPIGKVFAGWSDGTNVYEAGSNYEIPAGTKAVAFTAVYNVEISAITAPLNVIKVYKENLAVADLGLPTTVSVTTVDGEVDCEVVWDTTALVLDNTVNTEQIVSGQITIPVGYVLAEGVENAVSIGVTILATAPVVEAIENPSDIKVIALTQSIELPTEVIVTVNSDEIARPVQWTGGYDLNVVGEYTLTGTVDFGEFANTNELTVSQKIIVYADEIIAVEGVAQSVAVGATVNLPETVKVTVQDSLTMGTYEKTVAVVWNGGAVIDTSALGSQNVNGALTLDASLLNSANVPVIAVVNVINQTEINWVAYADGSEYDVDWTTVYTDKVLGTKNGIIVKAENGASSDGSHKQTKPMIKLNKGTAGAISIFVPSTATMISIEVDACAFGTGKEGSIQITNGTTVIGSADVSATSTNTDDNSLTYVVPTVATATYSGTTDGVYYIQASSENNLYVTAIRVKAIVPELMAITYNVNGGEGKNVVVEFEKGSTATVNSIPTPAQGYEFIGWNTQANGEGTSYANGDTFTINESVELFAVYKPLITAVEYNSMLAQVYIKASLDEKLLTQQASEIFGLPAQISATLQGATDPINVTVDWTQSLAELETATYAIGEYTLTGAISSVDYNFATDVNTNVVLVVRILESKLQITSFDALNVSVELGKTEALPTIVTANLSDLTTIDLAVDFSGANVDFALVGETQYDGVVTFDAETMELASAEVKAILTVTVYTYEITAIAPVGEKTAFVGGSIVLPAKVSGSYVDRELNPQTTELSVTWDYTAVDFTTVGSYTATGTVTFTDLFVKADGLSEQITAQINVGEYVASSTARSTNFADYARTGAGSVRGFTLTGTVEPGAMANLQGQKIKNGSITFELTRPAKVTFSIAYSKDLAIKLDGGSANGGLDLSVANYPVNQIHVLSFDLAAGSHSISSTSTSGSFSIGYVIIDDGGSEIFLATESENVLPSMPVTKTVDGVNYNFFGWVNKAGAQIYNPGETVDSDLYYALYLTASQVQGAAIQVGSTDKQIRFTSTIQMLNASALFDNLVTNNVISVSNAITLNSESVTSTEIIDKAMDMVKIYQIVAVEKFTNAYTLTSTAHVGSTEVLNSAITRSAKQVAESLISDVQTTSDAKYKFTTENGFSAYNTLEREAISAYIVDDSQSGGGSGSEGGEGGSGSEGGEGGSGSGSEGGEGGSGSGSEGGEGGSGSGSEGGEGGALVETLVTTEESLKNGLYVSELAVTEANTYYLGSAEGGNYIFKIEVTDATGTYVLNATDLQAFEAFEDPTNKTGALRQDGEEIVCGTNNAFTLILASGKTKVDASEKTFSDGFAGTQRINFGGKTQTVSGVLTNAIEFSTTGEATIKVWWVSGGDGRQVKVFKPAELGL